MLYTSLICRDLKFDNFLIHGVGQYKVANIVLSQLRISVKMKQTYAEHCGI
jgi:hypothetical protein